MTPGCCVSAEVVRDDEAFNAKMRKFTEKLGDQMAKGTKLNALIWQKLGEMGYGF